MAIANKYPTIRPSLNLDFANSKTIDPRITFSRASSATYFDEKGVMRTAPAGVPRIGFDPVTGECKGLLIEEQRTNLLLNSQFGSVSESVINNGWLDIYPELDFAPNYSVAPDGTVTAALLSINAPTSYKAVSQRTGLTTAGVYVFSCYLKPASTDTKCRLLVSGDANGINAIRTDFSLLDEGSIALSIYSGTATTSGNAPYVRSIGGGWYYCVVSATLAAPTNVTALLYPGGVTAQTVASQTLVWGAQLEAGAFPTSYIKTEASQVTRAADNANMTGTNFSGWANSVGTILVKYKTAGWKHNNTPPVTQLDLTKAVDDYSTPITSDGIQRVVFYPRQLTADQITALKG